MKEKETKSSELPEDISNKSCLLIVVGLIAIIVLTYLSYKNDNTFLYIASNFFVGVAISGWSWQFVTNEDYNKFKRVFLQILCFSYPILSGLSPFWGEESFGFISIAIGYYILYLIITFLRILIIAVFKDASFLRIIVNLISLSVLVGLLYIVSEDYIPSEVYRYLIIAVLVPFFSISAYVGLKTAIKKEVNDYLVISKKWKLKTDIFVVGFILILGYFFFQGIHPLFSYIFENTGFINNDGDFITYKVYFSILLSAILAIGMFYLLSKKK